MARLVKYNGGTESYYGCTDPTELVVGQVYEVINVTDKGWQTDLTLKGIPGHFNDCWFDDVKEDPSRVFIGVSRSIPVVNERVQCSIIQVVNGQPISKKAMTSPAQEVNYMGSNVYCVRTHNSLYIITVG